MFLKAQKQGNVWYFGDKVGLDFSSGTPAILTNGQTYLVDNPPHSEGTAVICDSAGTLLFYTNGVKVWNRNHLVMAHGDSLNGHPSSSQAALIVPMPGSRRYYYVFTTGAYQHTSRSLMYTVVDMCLDNGLGDVLSAQKNILLLDTMTEKLTGVLHANKNDYWVIAHKFFSDAFYAFRLSSAGITTTIVSHIGSAHPVSTAQIGAVIGQMKASPDGKKIALVSINCNPCVAEYFDFSDATGAISNSVNINTSPFGSYFGVSFSPDNTKLYISSPINTSGLYQFDLNAGSGHPDSVRASKYKLPTSKLSGGAYNGINALQLAVNGKIYVTSLPLQNPYLGVINNPNIKGAGCNYADSVINFGKATSYGLPNFIDSYKYPPATALGPPSLTVSSSNTLSCKNSLVLLNATGLSSYTWNTGSTSATLAVQPATITVYTVQGQDANGCAVTRTYTQQVQLCASLNSNPERETLISVFPNPNHGALRLLAAPGVSGQFILWNSMAQSVHSQTITEGENVINFSRLPGGIYQYTIVTPEGKVERGIVMME
jgi:hypothetical protein